MRKKKIHYLNDVGDKTMCREFPFKDSSTRNASRITCPKCQKEIKLLATKWTNISSRLP